MAINEFGSNLPSVGGFRGAEVLHGWDFGDYQLSCGSQKTRSAPVPKNLGRPFFLRDPV